jgi:hypothetical protein
MTAQVEPVALQVFKRGRWRTVAKITYFLGGNAPILAVAWRHQGGTAQAISLPTVVLDYAWRLGARWFYLRDDRRRRMWFCPLKTFWRGKLHPDGELYVPIVWLAPVTWCDWVYAETVLRLEHTGARGAQMPLWEVA